MGKSVKNIFTIGEYKITSIVTNELWKENCYIIQHLSTKEQILIDPGDNSDLVIQSVLENKGKLNQILITHAHHDHIGSVEAIYNYFNCSCELHISDSRLLRQAPMYALRFGGKIITTPGHVNMFEGQPDIYLGKQLVKVIHTPGHTPGSVCYNFQGFVFTGDTLFYKHIGRTDLPGGSAKILSDSINQLLSDLPDDTVIFPGHGRPWSVSEAKLWWQNVMPSPPEYNKFSG
jgi:glyoxylase-like metal-dependent hydrolase (beta-lactamase superfamily II)